MLSAAENLPTIDRLQLAVWAERGPVHDFFMDVVRDGGFTFRPMPCLTSDEHDAPITDAFVVVKCSSPDTQDTAEYLLTDDMDAEPLRPDGDEHDAASVEGYSAELDRIMTRNCPGPRCTWYRTSCNSPNFYLEDNVMAAVSEDYGVRREIYDVLQRLSVQFKAMRDEFLLFLIRTARGFDVYTAFRQMLEMPLEEFRDTFDPAYGGIDGYGLCRAYYEHHRVQ
jgi:hypothetical protein